MRSNLEKRLGIDVSRWQGSIDWAAVRADGIEFAFIKATEGATWTDPNFDTNWKQARENGVKTGAYHFFRATSKVPAQVDNFLRTIGPRRKDDLPPVLDVEDPNQWRGTTRVELTRLVLDWLERVHLEVGVRPLVYLSPSFVDEMLDASNAKLADYPLWIAHWTDGEQPRVPKPWTKWTFWQFSSKGKVSGITENVVDLDRWNLDA